MADEPTRTRIERYADAVVRRLACSPQEATRRRTMLVDQLSDAHRAGGLDDTFARLGSPDQAAAAFAGELSAPAPTFAQRIGAALLDNLPLLAVAVALGVQGLVDGGQTMLAFPPYVYIEAGGACVSVVPGAGCEYADPGLLYAIGMPLALAWSIVGLGLLESRFGGTPAKLLFGLRVVGDDGLRIRPGQGVLRRLSFLVGPLAWLDWLPFLAARPRRLLEFLAGTRVVVLPHDPEERAKGKGIPAQPGLGEPR